MSRCDDFRIQVASAGFDVSHFTRHVKDHLNHCQGCNSFISAIPFFDQSLKSLPVYDAPAKLIDHTIATIVAYDAQQKQILVSQYNKRINKFAISFTAIATVGLIYQLQPNFTVDGNRGQFSAKSIHKIKRFPVLSQAEPFLIPYNSTDNEGFTYSNSTDRTNLLHTLTSTSSVLQQPTTTLNYQSTFGYWSNSYLAEDIEQYYVSNQMRYWNYNDFYQSLGISKALELFSQPIRQPFEKPKESALAVYLQSDRSNIVGPTRMRVQVGIQARDFPLVESATKKLIARSLSLQINLAAGVQLFSIIGSHPLNDAPRNNSQRHSLQNQQNQQNQQNTKKQTNASRKVARTELAAQKTGDSSPKSEIKIIIPKYFAGDSHVVLLDVLVESPGQIAEVSLYYKDLLFHRTALNQANLTLSHELIIPEKLQDNVSKNLLALEISQTLKLSSKLLQNENRQMALNNIVSLNNRLAKFRNATLKWRKDKELMKDEVMLSNFVTAFKTLNLDNKQHQQYLQHTLKLAAWRKLGLGQFAQTNKLSQTYK